MKELLVVADNRMYIRRVLARLDKRPDISLRIAFHSTDIFDAYIQYHPDAILLDGAVYLPIPTILAQFEAYQWKCPFFIDSRDSLPIRPSENVLRVDIDRDDIPALLASLGQPVTGDTATDALPQYVTTDGESVSFESDLYYLMLSVCLSAGEKPVSDEMVEQLHAELGKIGKVEILSRFERDILCVMRKSDIRQMRGFAQAHSVISRITGLPYSSLYCESVTMEEANRQCMQMLRHAERSYCFGAQCVPLAMLQNADEKLEQEAYPAVISLVRCLFAQDAPMLEAILRKFYERTVIPFASLTALKCFHIWMQLVRKTALPRHMPTDIPDGKKNDTAAQECGAMCRYWEGVLKRYQAEPYLPVTESIILYIFEHWSSPELSLDSAAKALRFARAYISRVLKENTGVSFRDLLLSVRLQHACILLRTTQLAVRDIAAAVGYLDAQYFSKVFRKHIGVQPTEYPDFRGKEDALCLP